MALDTRLPLLAAQGAQVNLADLFAQQDDQKYRQQQMEMQRQQMEMQGQRYELDVQKHFADLDKEQREAMKAGLKDMSAAVQWADTPEKWQQVLQHYVRFDPQLGAIPFEQREQALIQLGQMGEYLEKTAPKIMSIDAGGSLAAVDPRTGQPNFTVLPNPGGAQPGAPAGGPQPGAVVGGYRFKGGNPNDRNAWEPVGDAGGNASGGFQP